MVGRCIEEFGQVDIMCNNAAALGTDLYIWEQTLENWKRDDRDRLDGRDASCTREVVKQSMLERRSGVILNFSSTAALSRHALQGRPLRGPRRRRCAGVLTKAVALEVGLQRHSLQLRRARRHRHRAAAELHPSHRRRTGRRLRDASGAPSMEGSLLRTISTTEDVAHLALFLASDEARTITGQSIPVDAGSYMQG